MATTISNRSKIGIFSNFKEKHPTATKIVKTGGYFIAGTAAALAISAGGYILLHDPKMGKDCWRAHFNKCGKPKIGYLSPERANFQTIKDFVIRKGHAWMPAYVCPICGKFHVGHKH